MMICPTKLKGPLGKKRTTWCCETGNRFLSHDQINVRPWKYTRSNCNSDNYLLLLGACLTSCLVGGPVTSNSIKLETRQSHAVPTCANSFETLRTNPIWPLFSASLRARPYSSSWRTGKFNRKCNHLITYHLQYSPDPIKSEGFTFRCNPI